MSEGRLERWSPLSGIAFAVLFVVGSVMFDQPPSTDASDAEIVAYYAKGSNQLKLELAYVVLTLAAVLFVWYVGILSARLRAVEGESGWLSRITIVSGAAFVTVMILGFLLGAAVADIGNDTDAFTVDPDTTRLLTDASYTFVFETALPLAAPLVFAASLGLLRARLLPRWLGRAGVAVSLFCLAGALGVPMGLFLLWIAIVAVYLMRGPRPTTS